jgi:ABC-type uncharacterized transport system substrate-binding protein
MSTELGAKRLALMYELLPHATRFAVLINPNVPNIESAIKGMQAAAAAIGRPIEILTASTGRELDAAFVSLVQKRVDALVVSPAVLFANHRVHLTTLAVRHGVPTIFSDRADADIGGLMSYSSSLMELYRQVGIYVGRILKGEKPAELPVMQPTKFEFVINLKTAKALGLAYRHHCSPAPTRWSSSWQGFLLQLLRAVVGARPERPTAMQKQERSRLAWCPAAVSAGRDHEILFAIRAVGHGRCLPSGR